MNDQILHDALDAFPTGQQLEKAIRQASAWLLDARNIIQEVVSSMPNGAKMPPIYDALRPEQEVLVNDAIFMYKRNVRLLELQSGLLQRLAKLVSSAMDRSTMHIQHLQSLQSPWKKLPDELWSEIFLIAAGDQPLQLPPRNGKQAPWSLLKVCHRWRQITLNQPHLWNNVIIRTTRKLFEHIQFAQNVLQRSQDLPLTLEYGGVSPGVTYVSRLPTVADNHAFISGLLRPLSEQLVSINLAVFCGESMLDIPRILPDSFLPRLQKIDIQIQPLTEGTRSTEVPWTVLDRFLTSSHLRRVNIIALGASASLSVPGDESIPLDFPLNLDITWQNLTTLTIFYIPLRLSSVYNLLAHHCSVLEELTVETLQAEPDEILMISRAPKQVLPRLRRLDLTGWPMPLFEGITTPNLLDFTLGDWESGDTVEMFQEEVPSFADFFRRSSPSINSMVLDAYPETIDFAPVLEMCTGIKNLSMKEVLFSRAAMLHFTASKRWPKQFFCKVQAADLATFKDALQEYATYLSTSGIANETTALYTELEIVDIPPSQQDVADELEEQIKQLYEASGWTLEF